MRQTVVSLRCLRIALAGLLLFAGVALAGDRMKITLEVAPDLENGKAAFAVCARCHLPESWGNADGTYPQLAGQHVNVLMKQLLDIRNGGRDNAAMRPFVQQRIIGGYQTLIDVVAYVSTLPMNPEHARGPWPVSSAEHAQGRAVYERNCAVCHGPAGEGDNALLYPRLQGQHYPYMLRQAVRVKNGLRTVDPAMQAVFDEFSIADLEKALNYVSHLPVPKAHLAPDASWRNPDFE